MCLLSYHRFRTNMDGLSSQTWLDFTALHWSWRFVVVLLTWWPQFAAARLTLPSPDGRHNRHKTENHRHDTFGWNTPKSSSHRLESPSRTTPSAHRRRSVRPFRNPVAYLQRKVSRNMKRWSLRIFICVDDGEECEEKHRIIIRIERKKESQTVVALFCLWTATCRSYTIPRVFLIVSIQFEENERERERVYVPPIVTTGAPTFVACAATDVAAAKASCWASVK